MKGSKLENNHFFPLGDEIEHVPYEFCACEPFPVLMDGRFLWYHEAVDCRKLIEQAESILIHTSAELWNKQQPFNKHTMKFHNFPPNETIYFPPTSGRG